MWSTVTSTRVWTDAFIQFFRDMIGRKIAMNQSSETENIMIETEFGYIYGKVDFDEDTSILDTHEYLSNIKRENIGLENTLLAKPILRLDINKEIFSDINTLVYFPFELQILTIYGPKKSISKNDTKLVFLGNEFRPLVNKDSYVNFYSDYSFGYLDTLVILHKNNVFKKSSVVLKNNYIKNLCLTCNNFYISDNYIECLQCSLEVFLDVSLYTVVEKIDVYYFTDVLSFGLKSSLDAFYKKAILCHSQVGKKSKNNALLYLFNQCPNTDKDIKYELLNEDTITYFICSENEFSDLEFYGDVFLEDYRDEIAQYMGINSYDINLLNSGLSFKYLNLINVNLVFKSQKETKCLEEYRNMVRKKMGRYECIDFSKKLKSNFFVEYIKHSSEYKDVLSRIMALNYNNDIDFWIKRDNYSLFVRLFDFDIFKKEFQIKFIVFISLNLFCENKNIYLPDLEYPIVIIETDCNNKICKNLKIYGKIVARVGIFNDFSFEKISFYGYFFELEAEIIGSSFINLVNKFNTLNKMHPLNMFLNCTINHIKNVYISEMNTSKELDLIKCNNIKVNNIDLRLNKWLSNLCLYETVYKDIAYLDEFGIKINNCYLSVIGCISLTSSLDEYQENCIKIINDLKKVIGFNTMKVTFIPSIMFEIEKLQLVKDKLVKMSTEKLLIDVFIT